MNNRDKAEQIVSRIMGDYGFSMPSRAYAEMVDELECEMMKNSRRGFILVPEIPTPEMDAHGKKALSDNGVDSVDDCDALVCWSAMIGSRPNI